MKQKVLFALIALFSFVSAWAVDPDPVAVTVTNPVSHTKYTAVLNVTSLPVLKSDDKVVAPQVTKVYAGEGISGDGFTPTSQKVYDAQRKNVILATQNLDECANYYIQVKFTEGGANKTIYVPFYTGQVFTDYQIIKDQPSFETSVGGGALKLYYKEQIDKWTDAGDEAKATAYANERDNWSVAAAKEGPGGDKYTHGVGFPWIVFQSLDDATPRRVVFAYAPDAASTALTDGKAAYFPWKSFHEGTADGLNGKKTYFSKNDKTYGVASTNEEFGLGQVYYDATQEGKTYSENNKFDATRFTMAWVPAEADSSLINFSWTMAPTGGDYNANYDWADALVIAVKGEGLAGEEVLTKGTDLYNYKVEFFKDINCTEQILAAPYMEAAGTYYVRVSVCTEMIPGDGPNASSTPKWTALDAKMFVVKRNKLTLTLLQLEKNYRDPDPVFVDVEGTWMYRNVNGEMQSFYTLTNANGIEVSPAEVRLTGVRFKRIKTGESVYTSDGSFAEYPYTVYLSEIHAISQATGTEDYEVVLGHNDVLMISPRDLSKLPITASDVVYNGAAHVIGADVELSGLTFKNFSGESFDIPENAYTVSYGEVDEDGDVVLDNINVKYEEGFANDLAHVAAGGMVTLTAHKDEVTGQFDGNFVGSKEIRFRILPRPIDEKLPVFATNEDGSIKFVDGQPVQAVKDGQPQTKNNDFGAWTFQVYNNNEPTYTGEAIVPKDLAFASCDGLKSLNKKLKKVNNDGEGDYEFIALDPEEFAGDIIGGVARVKPTNVEANVYSDGTPRKVQEWTEVDGKMQWKDVLVDSKPQYYKKPKVRIIGRNNYCGTRDIEYAIYPKEFNFDGDFDIEIGETQYTGETPDPEVTITDITWGNSGKGEDELDTPIDYTTQVNADGNVGESTVSVTGRGNYFATINPSLNTVGANITIAFNADALKKTYGDEDPALNTLYTIGGLLLKDKYAMNENAETSATKPYLDKKGNPTDDVTKADDSKLVKDLKAAITFSRMPGETVGFYPISFTTTLTPYKEDGEVVPFKYVYGNYIVTLSDFAVAVEADPENDIEAAPAKAPVFEIEKRWLTVTAIKQKAEFGTIDKNTDFTFDADGKKNYTISGWATGTVNGFNFDEFEGATGEEKEANVINTQAEGTAKIVVLPSSTTFAVGTPVTLTPDVDPHGTMLENYKFNWKSAILTVTPATLIATARPITKEYGILPAGLTYEYDVTGYQFPEGTKEADKVDKYGKIKKYINEYKPAGAPEGYEGKNPFHQIVPTPAEGEVDETHGGKDKGTYAIDVDRDEDGEPIETVAPTYENYVITYVPAELEITQKRLDVYALKQTIGYGEDIVTGTAANGKIQDEDVKLGYPDIPGDGVTSDPDMGEFYEKRRDEVAGKIVRMIGLVQDTNYPDDKVSAFTIDVARLDNPKVTAIGEYDPDENENTIGIMVGVAPMENYDIHVHFGKLIIAEDEPEIYLVRPYLNSDKLWEDQRGGTIWFQEDQAREADEEHAEAWTETVFVRRGKSAEREEWRKVKQTRALNTDAETWGDEDYDEAIVDNTTAQQIEDYDGLENVKVRFGHYAILADQWEALVLPFDIDVRKVSPMFGYALFNVVDEDKSTSDNLVFKKENRTIPANTPFLIKATDNTDLNQLVFKHVEIVNPETEADLTVEVAGNKFIGTYTGYWNKDAKADGKARAQFFGGKLYDGKGHDGVSTIYEFPLGAYFEFSSTASAGVRITVVDENGVSTDINVVEVAEEGAAAGAAEGWYTITGIKLEGKPATKGTYIYNGKVVYIK